MITARAACGVLLALSLLQSADSLDRRVQRFTQAGRRPAYEATMRAASGVIGNRVTVLVALTGIAAFGGPAGVATAGAALVVLVPVNVTVEVLKRAVGRARPDGERDPANASFPSSHAANAAALAVVLGRRWRRAAPAFALLAMIVAWSRIYLNRHFLTDVVVGVTLGVAIAWLALAWFERRGWLRAWSVGE